MLKPLFGAFPTDKRIAGIHSIPITKDGSLVMVWDKNEKKLTTVGGRIENNEDLDAALDRETIEEAGLILESNRLPIVNPMLGFKSFLTAERTLKGIEAMHMIRKGQTENNSTALSTVDQINKLFGLVV